MRTYFRYILIALLSCAVSCTTNDEIADPNSEGKMSLRLVSSAMTRASDAQHNEDFLDKVDLYLFGSTTEASKWHTTIDTDDNGSITLNQENESEIFIPASALNSVGDSPKLYVIANYDNTTSPLPESATLAELQKQVVAKASWGPTSATQTWNEQSSFVMEGLGDVTKTGNQLSGIVNLKRAAAKIDLSITDIVDQVEAGDYVWKPVVSAANALNVTLKNAVTTSYVGADWDKAYEYFGTNGSTINYTFTAGATTTVDGVTTTPYSQTYPFYSYSSDQAKGASEAYMVLVVPWQKYKYDDNGNEVPVGDVENLYYEVPIGVRDNKRIERNYHYKVSIYVGTLGSKSKEESVTLEPEITVVDWSTGQIAVDIKEARYLVVDKKKIEIFNQTDCKVNYATSHTEGAMILSITRPNYTNQETEGIDVIYSYNTENNTSTGSLNGFALNCTDGVLSVSHVLDNDTNNYPYDYAPYTIIVRIYHIDEDDTFYEDVTFVQYPAMYITLEKNEGTNNKGYVYVYGYNADNTSYWYSVRGRATSGANSNPNMYTITVSALGANSQYIIGDPRVTTPITGSSINLTKEDATNRDKTLDNYYPTRTDADAKNIIAPKFRIASSYGRCGNSITYDEAERRCAAYQEYGYPAGRWRVPTMAEVMYVAKLSSDGIFPHLFGTGNDYWAAQGGFTYTINGNTATVTERSDGNFVRCVYDEWYWGSESIADKTTFTWGDMPR